MAEQLNMNGLSLNDSQHAPPPSQPHQNGFGEKSAYIPPHMRQQRGGPAPAAAADAPNGFEGAAPPPMAAGMNGSAWAPQGYVLHSQFYLPHPDPHQQSTC